MAYALQELQNIAAGKPAYPQSNKPQSLGQFYQNAGVAGRNNGTLPGQAQLRSTPVPTNSGGGGGGNNNSNRDPHINPATGVWDDEYFARNNQPSEPQYDWDAIYRPQFEALDQAENVARDNYGSLLSDQDRAIAKSKAEIEDSKADANAHFQKGEHTIGQNKLSAQSYAERAYNSLRQKAIAGWGGVSSVGQALNEQAQQEYFRQSGEVEKSYNNLFEENKTAWNNSLKQHAKGLFDIEEWDMDKRSEYQRQLNTDLLNIQQQKAMTTADKNAKRLEVMDRAYQFRLQQDANKKALVDGLNIWKEQQRYLQTNNLVPTYSQSINSQGYQPTNSFSNIGGLTQAQAPVVNLKWNPNSGKFEEEE